MHDLHDKVFFVNELCAQCMLPSVSVAVVGCLLCDILFGLNVSSLVVSFSYFILK